MKIISATWVSLIVGCTVAAIILYMVRRNRMVASHSLWWLTVAAGCLLLGVFPKMVDWVAIRVGVYYPPTFVMMIVIAMLLLKVLTMDTDLAEKERRIRSMAQRIAILEHEIRSRSIKAEKHHASE